MKINQTIWEAWLVASSTLFIIIMIIGTFHGSKDFFPNWPIAAIASIANVLICIYIGVKVPKDKQ
jgi:hypothetical protein